ncbi:MAG: molybdenum cofactor guanylyltransferase [Pseudomonadota bacterium]|uniref:Molybdenum cofactor guanylyltransferase n=1 Tax=Rheinheimera nanhaiensis E407-8 TaxID=562729 RepID=I1DV51_9GAMM|nr:molybdenum cofactor guanylyltransferase [Rheinheimera nanhaiensis]GAB57929.1 molybdopterin-guanine dinucleotide biosynthesis protein A [Rheinheimera nanhaiensis E407-8]
MSITMPFSALILAGGQSSRMGQDKALLQLNGQSLLAHMQQVALDSGAVEVLVSRNLPGFIADNTPQQGPLAGILAALQHCSSSQLLVLPIDTPLLTVTSVQRLLQHANGAACYFSDNPLPCVLPVTPALSPLISAQLRTGQRSVHALLKLLKAKSLAAPNTELLNTNTPADWRHCLTLLNSGGSTGSSNKKQQEDLCQSQI